jgi:hypothetical protein
MMAINLHDPVGLRSHRDVEYPPASWLSSRRAASERRSTPSFAVAGFSVSIALGEAPSWAAIS